MSVDAAPAGAPSPPGCILARIIKLEVVGSDSVVLASAGLTQGITNTWRVALDDPARTVGTLLRISKTTTSIKFSVTSETIAANPTARLCP